MPHTHVHCVPTSANRKNGNNQHSCISRSARTSHCNVRSCSPNRGVGCFSSFGLQLPFALYQSAVLDVHRNEPGHLLLGDAQQQQLTLSIFLLKSSTSFQDAGTTYRSLRDHGAGNNCAGCHLERLFEDSGLLAPSNILRFPVNVRWMESHSETATVKRQSAVWKCALTGDKEPRSCFVGGGVSRAYLEIPKRSFWPEGEPTNLLKLGERPMGHIQWYTPLHLYAAVLGIRYALFAQVAAAAARDESCGLRVIPVAGRYQR